MSWREVSIGPGLVRLRAMTALDAATHITVPAAGAPLLPPVERPSKLVWKVAFFFMRRKFGKVMGPAGVFSARMPFAFTSFYGKVPKLDNQLAIDEDTALLVREQVATLNRCLFCMDATKATALRKSEGLAAKVEALGSYRSSDRFSAAERAALDYVTELTRTRSVSDETFAALKRHHSEREICDIVWLVASEHLYNLNNLALNIGSDGFCDLLAK
jgi:alkylhydroperoxidase family enzyme